MPLTLEQLMVRTTKPLISDISLQVLQELYEQYLLPYSFVYELSNDDTIVLHFEKENFCHLFGLEKMLTGKILAMDLKKYKGMHQFLKENDPDMLFNKLPKAVNDAMYNMFLVDGISKADKQKMAIRIMKEAAGGTMNMLKLGYKGWRSMNG